MPTIVELFGFETSDKSEEAIASRANHQCPFVAGPCTKTFSDGTVAGVCSLSRGSTVVPVCPKRLYAEHHKPLRDIAAICFPATLPLVSASSYDKKAFPQGAIVGFGHGWGGELRLPGRGTGKGSYSVDWILAQVRPNGDLEKFVAVEVQTIDTTGSYKNERHALMSGTKAGSSKTGFNWENVNKRILPQLIYKGHILRREQLCGSGLFFICPEQIYDSMVERLGGLENLEPYPQRPGTITFMPYVVPGTIPAPGTHRPLILVKDKIRTTTIEQIEMAFSSAKNLPEGGVYERAIKDALMSAENRT